MIKHGFIDNFYLSYFNENGPKYKDINLSSLSSVNIRILFQVNRATLIPKTCYLNRIYPK